jgi:hypothetical protein
VGGGGSAIDGRRDINRATIQQTFGVGRRYLISKAIYTEEDMRIVIGGALKHMSATAGVRWTIVCRIERCT